jgi:hypothetical protein
VGPQQHLPASLTRARRTPMPAAHPRCTTAAPRVAECRLLRCGRSHQCHTLCSRAGAAVQALGENGILKDLLTKLPQAEQYTYSFEGNSQARSSAVRCSLRSALGPQERRTAGCVPMQHLGQGCWHAAPHEGT